MQDRIKAKIIARFPRLWTYKYLLTGANSYLTETGWRESVRRGYPCGPDGAALPWMNYHIISFLEDRLTKDLSLFEFGSGFSTVFYSRLVGSVTSVENDKEWYRQISEQVAENVQVVFVDSDVDGDYCRTINLTDKTYDLVVVDGRDRVNCVEQSFAKLTDRGVIVLDDSQREKYLPALESARDRGFRILDFEGLKPKGLGFDRTSIFYRSDNCLNI